MYDSQMKSLFRSIVGVWIFLFATTSVILIVAMPKDSAHSMIINSSVVDNNSSPIISSVQAAVESDPCLPLLQSRRAQNNNKNGAHAVNRTSNQPSSASIARAGTTAAIALMLGARYAISPLDKQSAANAPALDAKNPQSVSKDVSRTTLSITEYRQCKKEYALKVLNNR